MTRPRDFDVADRTGWVKIGRIYSNVVSPPTMVLALSLTLAMASAPWPDSWWWFFWHALFVSLLPVLFTAVLLRTGHVKELHMSNQRERRLPYLAAVLGAGLAVIVLTYLNAPALMRCLAMFNVVQAVSLATINLFWLISTHTTAAMSVAAIITLVFGWLPGLLIGVPLVASIVAVRIYLRRHTVAQALFGCLLGLLTVMVLVPFGCFSTT
jgi:hypothetical protein